MCDERSEKRDQRREGERREGERERGREERGREGERERQLGNAVAETGHTDRER